MLLLSQPSQIIYEKIECGLLCATTEGNTVKKGTIRGSRRSREHTRRLADEELLVGSKPSTPAEKSGRKCLQKMDVDREHSL